MRVLIIGAGIGGLTAGIALKQAEIEPQIYEREPELHEAGAGISLAANAMAVLQQLGIAEAVVEAGAIIQCVRICTWRGRHIGKADLSRAATVLGAPTVCIHRADLQQILYRAMGKKHVHPGHRLIEIAQNSGTVTAAFVNGHRTSGDLLIGADGIHSLTRAWLHGARLPRYSGYTCWRGIVDFSDPLAPRDAASESWGPGARFGIVPIGGERFYWFATKNAPAGGQGSAAQHKTDMQRIFRGWHLPIEALIEATPAEAILRNDIYDRPPLRHWRNGRITLLGDAAHPMTPNLGQGACQAMEDALILTGCLKNAPDMETALQNYERQRISRTTWMVKTSYRLGKIAQWENALLRAIRDNLMRKLPAEFRQKQLLATLNFEQST